VIRLVGKPRRSPAGGVTISGVTDQTLTELLAAGDDALAEAGFRTGDFGPAREVLAQAQAQAEAAGDQAARARALDLLGMLAHFENITRLMTGGSIQAEDIQAEERLFRQALAAWQEAGARAATAHSLFGLGLVYQVLHRDWSAAMPYYWEALDLAYASEPTADLYLRSEVHRHVGFYFLVEDEQPTEAVRHLQLSLDLREELGDPRRIPSGQVALARAELAAGHRDRAIELLTSAVTQARETGLLAERIADAERALREAQEQTGDGDT
jgi:tetratricopeptide (TPR) repeat protein